MTAPQTPQSNPASGFVGWLLIMFGVLIVLLCGGCTLTMWGVGIAGLIEQPSAAAWGAMIGEFFFVLLIGGVPTAGGAVLIWAGWRALHPIRAPKDAAKTFE